MWKEDGKVLGVVGGMGPGATQLFYKKLIDLNAAESDQDHLDMIILNHASMPDRTKAILEGRTEDLFDKLLHDVKKLEADGVTVIAIPCNTSHLLLDRLQDRVKVPIINMIKETAREIKKTRPACKKVGVLATDGTVFGGLYQQAIEEAGLEPVLPSEKGQALVMKIIYEGVKAGKPIDYNDFIKIQGELAAQGCEAAIMGCTELSMVKEEYKLPEFFVDAMDVLAKKSILMCGGKLKGHEQ